MNNPNRAKAMAVLLNAAENGLGDDIKVKAAETYLVFYDENLDEDAPTEAPEVSVD